MKIAISLLAVCIIMLYSCGTNTQQQTSATNILTAPDDSAIRKAVENAYASISFEAGQTLNYDSIQYAFIPQAQLINFIDDTAQILSINDFARAFKNYVETTKIQSFKEQELWGRTDQFGNIAQRISTYKTYVNSTDFVKERGVNSFQLIKTPQGWKVSSIIWDIERSDRKIPDYFLGK